MLTAAGKKVVIPEPFRRILMKDARADPFNDSQPQMEIVPSTFSFSDSWRRKDLGGNRTPYMVIRISPRKPECLFDLVIDMDRVRLIGASLLIDHIEPVPIDLSEVDATKKKEKSEAGYSNSYQPPCLHAPP